MRKIAKATVRQVETTFDVTRDSWGDDGATLPDDALVVFYLDESNGADYLYMADCDGQFLFSGSVPELPREWLDAPSLEFYFQATVDEFTMPGFLERYFAEE